MPKTLHLVRLGTIFSEKVYDVTIDDTNSNERSRDEEQIQVGR